MHATELRDRLPAAAFAFRGYNVTNLGRSRELLERPDFGPVVEKFLREGSEICSSYVGRTVDLVGRVRRNEETTLDTFDEAITLLMAMELAQLELAEKIFGLRYRSAKVAFGYSLGEAGALVAGGAMSLADILKAPLLMARECVELAADVTMGVLFSHVRELPVDDVKRICLQINAEGRGVIGISAILSPNSVLLLGQRSTIDRFRELMKAVFNGTTHLRKNRHRWPPLHTPLLWERNIPNRSAVILHTVQSGFTAPKPPVLSLVTGKLAYNDFNTREMLHKWVDHPQRLWDVVCETLTMGIETIIHVGPAPNIIPATYERLKENVETQTQSSYGMLALSIAASRPWLKNLLPVRTALLRTPQIAHVILEDWLLAQPAP